MIINRETSLILLYENPKNDTLILGKNSADKIKDVFLLWLIIVQCGNH